MTTKLAYVEREHVQNSALLILGPRHEWIPFERDFLSLGFSVFFEADMEMNLLRPWQEGAEESCRTLLERFQSRARELCEPGTKFEFYVHPGVGPWSESPLLEEAALSAGIHAITASVSLIQSASNLVAMRDLAAKHELQSLWLHDEPLGSLIEIRRELARISKDRRIVRLRSLYGSLRGVGTMPVFLDDAWEPEVEAWLVQLNMEAPSGLFVVEEFIENVRTFETFVTYGRSDEEPVFWETVDTSLQFRGKVWVELSASCLPRFDEFWALAEAKFRSFLRGARLHGAFTIEWGVLDERIIFIGLRPRLPDSSWLMSKLLGQSLPVLQLSLLDTGNTPPRRSERLQGMNHPMRGLSLRLYAEEALTAIPRPGFVSELLLPRGADVSLALKPGRSFRGLFGPSCGQVLFMGHEREEVVRNAANWLSNAQISGAIQTNRIELKNLLESPSVVAGYYDCVFLDQDFSHFSFVEPAVKKAIKTVLEEGPSSVDSSRFLLKDVVFGNFHQKGILSDSQQREEIWFSAFPLSKTLTQVNTAQGAFTLKRKGAPSFRTPFLSSPTVGEIVEVYVREGSVLHPLETFALLRSCRRIVPIKVGTTLTIRDLRCQPGMIVEAGQCLALVEKKKEN